MARHLLRYLRGVSLRRLDGRTREARMVADLRAELLAHVGASATVAQRMLVERATMLNLQCALIERRFVEKGDVSDNERWLYIGFCCAIVKVLALLGVVRDPRTFVLKMPRPRAAAGGNPGAAEELRAWITEVEAEAREIEGEATEVAGEDAAEADVANPVAAAA